MTEANIVLSQAQELLAEMRMKIYEYEYNASESKALHESSSKNLACKFQRSFAVDESRAIAA